MKQRNKRLLSVLLSLALLLSLIPATAVMAKDAESTSLPAKWDLREQGVVTPVKRQNPWGSCWSFGGIAAAETSILSMLGTTNEEWKAQHDGENFDLSEKHLVWFASTLITAETDTHQAGEGLYVVDYQKYKDTDIYKAQDAQYNGGVNTLITNLFGNGIGPVYEKYFPYWGAGRGTEYDYFSTYESESAAGQEERMAYVVKEAEKDLMELTGDTEMTLVKAVQQLRDGQAQASVLFRGLFDSGCLDQSFPDPEKNNDELLAQLKDAYYAKKIKDLHYTNDYTKKLEDWTIAEHMTLGGEEVLSRDIYCGYTLLNGNVLPEPVIRDENDKYVKTNEEAIAAIKSELYAGRGVNIGFYADTSMPGDPDPEGGYMNLDTWAQYTYDDLYETHGVCIVGWDDTISKETFSSDPEKQPPAGGAWIVKNSWGSETEYVTLTDKTFDTGAPQTIGQKAWGIVNAEGKHTGYFYLSYYDKNIGHPESMEFATDLSDANGDFAVWSHSYMPSTTNWNEEVKPTVIKTANIFANDSEECARLYSIASQIAGQNATVEYAVYLLNDDSVDPEDGVQLLKMTKHYDYAGFHREPLDGSIVILPGDRIAIVVSESTPDENGNKQYTYSVNVAISKAYSDDTGYPYYGIAVVNEGESFIYDEGKWIDWTVRAADTTLYEEAFVADNPGIKAYVIYDAARAVSCPKADICPTARFSDLDLIEWYHDGVHFVLENSIMNGVGNGKFNPGGNTDRDMIAQILWNMEDKPVANYAMTYSDVPAGRWYTEAVRWASSQGIMKGDAAGTFRPEASLTREELATVLYRYAQGKGKGFTGLWSFQLDYPDAGTVSSWANEAMCWMVMNGIIKGNGQGYLAPKATATRAEMATMIMRFLENLK